MRKRREPRVTRLGAVRRRRPAAPPPGAASRAPFPPSLTVSAVSSEARRPVWIAVARRTTSSRSRCWPPPAEHRQRQASGHTTPAERTAILDALHSVRFADLASDEVWATLLDEGTYLGSVSTYYRVLREAGESRERRRRQAAHPAAVKPELLATGPNQVWSWDITMLPGPGKGPRSTSTSSWTSSAATSSAGWWPTARVPALAERLIARNLREAGMPEQLSHPLRSWAVHDVQAVAQLLADLGVTKSQSRPHVSNDNPFSEASSRP